MLYKKSEYKKKMQSATTEDLYNGWTKCSSDILLGSLHSNSM